MKLNTFCVNHLRDFLICQRRCYFWWQLWWNIFNALQLMCSSNTIRSFAEVLMLKQSHESMLIVLQHYRSLIASVRHLKKLLLIWWCFSECDENVFMNVLKSKGSCNYHCCFHIPYFFKIIVTDNVIFLYCQISSLGWRFLCYETYTLFLSVLITQCGGHIGTYRHPVDLI